MKTAVITGLVAMCVGALAAGGLRAQSLPSSQSSRPPGGPAPKPPPRESGISERAAAAISAGFKYTPPPPPKPATDEDEVDLRDIDKPKNQIVRLPKYTVTAKKPPVFGDRALYTQDQLKTLAVSRYLTKLDTGLLNRWTIPGFGMSNEQRALQMFQEDERLQNMSQMRQDISLLRETGDPKRAEETQADYYDMFLRRRDDVHTETFSKRQGQ